MSSWVEAKRKELTSIGEETGAEDFEKRESGKVSKNLDLDIDLSLLTLDNFSSSEEPRLRPLIANKSMISESVK